MSSSTTPASTTVASARTGRSYDAYPVHIPREIAPGIMDDGTMSATHPLVQQFVAYTTRKFLEAEARAAVAGPHKDKRWHGAHKHPLVTRWRCLKGGAARVEDVHAALGPGVTDRLAGAIFALGALSVYSYWAKPAHWAFWALNIVEETAAVVHPVVRADPKVIHVPDDVAWVDVEMAVNVLRAWHGGFVPRQRKKKQAKIDESKEDSDGETKNTNGKRIASEDSLPIPSKRTRTKANKDLLPTRRSTRTRKGEQGEPVYNAALDTTPTAPLKTAEPTSHESEEMVVDVESMETGENLNIGLERQAQEPPVAQRTKKARSKPARARKSTGGRKRGLTRKPRAPSGDTPSKQPLPTAPLSPSPCTIRIPARSTPSSVSPSPALRELLDKVSASQTSGETSAAASRESTAVGTPFSGLSTRVGTPQLEFEVKVEPVVVKPKAVRDIFAPVRTSARIRAKTLAGASQRR